MSTSAGKDKEKEQEKGAEEKGQGQVQDPPGKASEGGFSLASLLPKNVVKYGATGVSTYFGVYVVTLGSMYAMVSAG